MGRGTADHGKINPPCAQPPYAGRTWEKVERQCGAIHKCRRGSLPIEQNDGEPSLPRLCPWRQQKGTAIECALAYDYAGRLRFLAVDDQPNGIKAVTPQLAKGLVTRRAQAHV